MNPKQTKSRNQHAPHFQWVNFCFLFFFNLRAFFCSFHYHRRKLFGMHLKKSEVFFIQLRNNQINLLLACALVMFFPPLQPVVFVHSLWKSMQKHSQLLCMQIRIQSFTYDSVENTKPECC